MAMETRRRRNLGSALLTTAHVQPLDHHDTTITGRDAALETQALEVTGTASVRRLYLAAKRGLRLMLGLALLCDSWVQAV